MKEITQFINEKTNKTIVKDQLRTAIQKLGDEKVSSILYKLYGNGGWENALDELDNCEDEDFTEVVYSFFPGSAIDALINAV